MEMLPQGPGGLGQALGMYRMTLFVNKRICSFWRTANCPPHVDEEVDVPQISPRLDTQLSVKLSEVVCRLTSS